jgi:hypothetical protein
MSTMIEQARVTLWVAMLVGLLAAVPVEAQTQADVALDFFRAGGAYCFRIAPPGVALSEETEWTIMLLTSASNRKTAFKIRELDPGATGLRGQRLKDVGEDVTAVWRSDRLREDFFARFAMGMAGHQLRARVVRISPGNLGQLATGRARAELYLKFSERGSTVAFDKTQDLEAPELAQYSEYLPD